MKKNNKKETSLDVGIVTYTGDGEIGNINHGYQGQISTTTNENYGNDEWNLYIKDYQSNYRFSGSILFITLTYGNQRQVRARTYGIV